MAISPARLAAFRTLLAIEFDGAFSSDALAAAKIELAGKDRSLCHEVVLGVLRRLIYLDRVIDKITGGKKLDPAVRITLQLGIYQLLFLDRVPDYSAVNESVELVRRAKKSSATGFVNAALRRVTRESIVLDYTDDTDRLSVSTSHPRWLIEHWIREFGEIDAFRIAAANNEVPSICFRHTIRTNRAETADMGRTSGNVEGCFVSNLVSPELLELERGGRIYFQDEASQLVAASVGKLSGRRVLDVCSAPGSKTGVLAMRGADLVVAGDVSNNRIALLRTNLERQGVLRVPVCQFDAAVSLPFRDRSFDVVLVDAPCSGTGTIRHNPEIRYRLKKTDFERLADKQLLILINASKVVNVGGRIVYSTCSLERVEGEDVIARFLKETSNYDSVRPPVEGRFVTNEGFGRTFPHRDLMDGFFIANLVRRS